MMVGGAEISCTLQKSEGEADIHGWGLGPGFPESDSGSRTSRGSAHSMPAARDYCLLSDMVGKQCSILWAIFLITLIYEKVMLHAL